MRAALRAFGELGITAGVIVLLFCAYLLWGTGAYTAQQQTVLRRQLLQEFKKKEPPRLGAIRLGGAMALLRIPRFGHDYRYAIVEGVGPEELRLGPGHYPGSAMPGKIGNFVLSGHRTTYAAPFNRIGELRRGDDIVVDTREARYTYQVTGTRVVAPTEVGVVAPVPDRPGRKPTNALITLATCHPEYSAAQRLIVFGKLGSSRERLG
ncbi:class E sortase [Streptosporangium sp. NBC_01639]|uniref:class E sortase n=1 Tax=unclassified Streptosporangium TaxID=2632669 RepID=UPI002DDAE883|nr:class E sortase [Streptosporangium sp. NBC_01756]WSC90305.1 class E sortase [Streptosporangium sp. NBC_01756]WTD58816.1 class E sortase [Streptosporangium sp. NBC_01639]